MYHGSSIFMTIEHVATINGMEEKIIVCLDDVPLLQIQWCIFFSFLFFSYHSLTLIRFANQSAQFISVYSKGHTTAQAICANRKYHSHCTLPPEMIAYIKQSVSIWYIIPLLSISLTKYTSAMLYPPLFTCHANIYQFSVHSSTPQFNLSKFYTAISGFR